MAGLLPSPRYHGRKGRGFSRIAISEAIGAKACTKQNGTMTGGSNAADGATRRRQRRYSLGETPTWRRKRLLKDPRLENPTSKQASVTLRPARRDALARSM